METQREVSRGVGQRNRLLIGSRIAGAALAALLAYAEPVATPSAEAAPTALSAAAPHADKSGQKPKLAPAAITHLPMALRQPVYYANMPDGYVIGNAVKGDTVEASDIKYLDSDNKVWVAARIKHKVDPKDRSLGWIEERKIQRAGVKVVEHVTLSQHARTRLKQMVNRYEIGQDFNCGDHECEGGTFFTRLEENATCKFTPLSLNYNDAEGNKYNVLPVAQPKGGFHYRYTSPDGTKAWGMTDFKVEDLGTITLWGTYPRSCVPGHPRGGPELSPVQQAYAERNEAHVLETLNG